MELMIAMTIFVVFTGILINSYSAIVKAQRGANDYRILYTEARTVFDTLTEDFRNNTVNYCTYNAALAENDEIFLISKDALRETHIKYDEAEQLLQMSRTTIPDGTFDFIHNK